MKSKISCFNPTIFWKNISLFWPLWGGLSLLWLVFVPINLCLLLDDASKYATEPLDLCYCLTETFDYSFSGMVRMAAIISVATTLCMFYYLFHARSSYMMQAFPVSRKELFLTNYISSLVIQIFPLFLSAIISVLISLSYQVTYVECIAYWLLIMVVIVFIFTSMVVLCVMLSGQLFAVPVFVAILNFFVAGIRFLVGNVLAELAWGLSYSDLIKQNSKIVLLSPAYELFGELEYSLSFLEDKNGGLSLKITYGGIKALIAYFLVSFLFLALAYWLYKRRKMEYTGDVLAFPCLRPIFRWGVGICFGLLVGLWGIQLLALNLQGKKGLVFMGLYLLVGLIGYFIAEMLIQRSFHIVQKKLFIELIPYLAVIVITGSAFSMGALHLEKCVPEKAEIQSAEIYVGDYQYQVELDTDQILDIHRQILEQKDVYIDDSNFDQEVMVTIEYTISNERKLCRTYELYLKEDSAANEIVNELFDKAKAPDQFLKGLFCEEYEKGQITGGDLFTLGSDYLGLSISESEANQLMDAINEDCEDGTLQKYNGLYSFQDNQSGYGEIVLNFNFPDGTVPEDPYYTNYFNNIGESVSKEGYYTEVSYYVSFGKDCEHMVETLEELGYIKDASDLSTEEEMSE